MADLEQLGGVRAIATSRVKRAPDEAGFESLARSPEPEFVALPAAGVGMRPSSVCCWVIELMTLSDQ